MANSPCDIEVVICTRNRATLLASVLSDLQACRVPPGVEILVTVVDNGSTDDTEARVGASRGPLTVRYFSQKAPGKSKALNLALNEARGNVLLFTDDDVQLPPAWLEAAHAAAGRHPNAGVFGGPVQPVFEVRPNGQLLEAFPVLSTGFCGLEPDLTEGAVPPDLFFVGANMAVRRSVIGSLRFDETLGPGTGKTNGGEETAFLADLRRQDVPLVWIPAMGIRHFVPKSRMSLPYILRFLFENGRVTVYTRGVPPGQRLLGVPRWLVSSILTAYLDELRAFARGDRVRELRRRGERSRLWGMVQASRELTSQAQARQVAHPWS